MTQDHKKCLYPSSISPKFHFSNTRIKGYTMPFRKLESAFLNVLLLQETNFYKLLSKGFSSIGSTKGFFPRTCKEEFLPLLTE